MKRRRLQAFLLAGVLLVGSVLTGCGSENAQAGKENAESGDVAEEKVQAESQIAAMQTVNDKDLNVVNDKYRTFYEVFLYSFYDSDGDGIGDINGLIDKLDYINDGDDNTDTDLGCNGIWLMPIMPSTTYHKYDVTDYEDIDSQYGTMEEFEALVAECHSRGIHLIIDYVMNHTSSQHPWFQEACSYLEGLNGAEPSEEECPYFGYYNFTRDKKSSVYYPVGESGWYYEAQFWSEMPDLNLDHEAVRTEFADITDFWLDKGVDGFRLDAVSQYTTGATKKNVEVLSWFHDMVTEKKEDAYIVGEDWEDMDVYSQYYGSGIDSLFNFDFADSTGIIASSLNNMSGCDASTYGKAVANLDAAFSEYNENYIDAPFYTNHDMGRSAGYYAGDNSEEKTKMAGAMNLMMSGCAFVYYGEELGMKGSGKDENKRAPMYWSMDAETEGMCAGPTDMDTVKMKFESLAEQQDASDSIYNFYKQAIKLRNIYPEIARGNVSFVKEASNENVCVLVKEYEGSSLCLVFNLSAENQTADLSALSNYSMEDSYELGGELLTVEGDMNLAGQTLELPAYSMAVIQ